MTFFAVIFAIFSAAISILSTSLGVKALSSEAYELVGIQRLAAILFLLFGMSAGINALFVIALLNT